MAIRRSKSQLQMGCDFPIVELATDTHQYSLGFFSLAVAARANLDRVGSAHHRFAARHAHGSTG